MLTLSGVMFNLTPEGVAPLLTPTGVKFNTPVFAVDLLFGAKNQTALHKH